MAKLFDPLLSVFREANAANGAIVEHEVSRAQVIDSAEHGVFRRITQGDSNGSITAIVSDHMFAWQYGNRTWDVTALNRLN